MKDLEAARIIQDAYKALSRKVEAAAWKKLMAGALHKRHEHRHLSMDYFEIESETITVAFSYDEPYSGTEEVILTAADLEG